MNKTQNFNNTSTGKVCTLIDSATTLTMTKKPNPSKDSSKPKAQKSDKEKANKK